ncbi:MAG TPA: hypothetical protein VE954_37820 [Oligoflexus sp.]|uniref:hypothetical protein n=1 Tax=Oligoflexus sp. TaxID=1971216 RepID=UPI002D3DE483|nr:hypothetical protein [Oligoflexus sp.]HYX38900.1 hypothetical protein [Oligoflexus sp.]
MTSLEQLFVGLACAQGIFIAIDELVFHRRRGLGTFERWGHIADSLLFAAPLGVTVFFLPQGTPMLAFIALAVLSSLLVTKDEWIHAAECRGGEHWCHSILFTLHGTVLLTAAFLWQDDPYSWPLKVMPLLVLGWGGYQFLYWHVYIRWRESKAQ